MPKYDNDPPVLLCSRAFARDDHYLAPCISLRRDTKLSLTSLHTDRGMALTSSLMASLRSVMVLGFLRYTRIEICTHEIRNFTEITPGMI